MSPRSSTDPLSVLGDRLRARRKAVGLSLRGLAAQLEMSPSALSQIETGRSQPSVASLYEISRALQVPLDSLFVDAGAPATPRTTPAPARRPTWTPTPVAPTERPVLRAHERPAIDLESGVSWELLTVEADPDVDFLHVTYPPGACSSEGLLHHPGSEYGLVLEGVLTVTVESHDRVLLPGDSIHLDSSVPHRLRNDGEQPADAIWVVLRGPHA